MQPDHILTEELAQEIRLATELGITTEELRTIVADVRQRMKYAIRASEERRFILRNGAREIASAARELRERALKQRLIELLDKTYDEDYAAVQAEQKG